jgi:hypothetical protein
MISSIRNQYQTESVIMTEKFEGQGANIYTLTEDIASKLMETVFETAETEPVKVTEATVYAPNSFTISENAVDHILSLEIWMIDQSYWRVKENQAITISEEATTRSGAINLKEAATVNPTLIP